MLTLVGRKALIPPLGLLTVAALLPKDWEVKLVDRSIRSVTEDEWQWTDLVLVSSLIAQREDFLGQIREAKQRGKCVVVGGPYPTSVPSDAEAAGADYLVLDEAEITLPMFLKAMADDRRPANARRQRTTIFRADGEKPDVTKTPVSRYDLLEFDAYDMMSVQFSRGCPFLCEFCDIITLYGRRPRTKTPAQFLAELDLLYDLGWRQGVFLVDDNFIGHKRDVKLLLKALRRWQSEHRYPFRFDTEASIDLARDPELLRLMHESNFGAVFVGIETPDIASLALIKKVQNTRRPLVEDTRIIMRAGLRVMAGFIVGFDGEQPGAGRRIMRFVEEAAVPTANISLLEALPHTGLWKRLESQGRLLGSTSGLTGTGQLNFVPTRPVDEIVTEYVDLVWDLYDPARYLDRVYRCFKTLGRPVCRPAFVFPKWAEVKVALRALSTLCWRQGVRRQTRWKFWHHVFSLLWAHPRAVEHYLAVCAHNEHFLVYREIVREKFRLGSAGRRQGEVPSAVATAISSPGRRG